MAIGSTVSNEYAVDLMKISAISALEVLQSKHFSSSQQQTIIDDFFQTYPDDEQLSATQSTEEVNAI